MQAIQDELDKAHAAKSEANFAIDNSDSVDKSIIQALKNEGEDQKQTIADLSQEVAELTSKFLSKEQEAITLSSQLTESNSKLEMTELNLKQLRSASNDDYPFSESDQFDQNKEQNGNNSSTNISSKEHDNSHQKENDDLHTRIEE